MSDLFATDKGRKACPVYLLTRPMLDEWLETFKGRQSSWVSNAGFKAGHGDVLLVPDKSGDIESVLVGQGILETPDYWTLANVISKVPAGTYRLTDMPSGRELELAAIAWAMGSYRFDRYLPLQEAADLPQLVLPKEAPLTRITALYEAVFQARNLINTPANDMGPEALELACKAVAEKYGAEMTSICGEDLLHENYPLIHAVGRTAKEAPRFIELNWGAQDAPKVTLVGKGVCFDSGGLNIKSGAAMELMKKDMGGAACVLGLAQAIMQTGLAVRLRVLIGAVENAIGPDAFRPGDVLVSRKGLSVEIGNTDAEGRLVLADLLTEAEAQDPDLLIDMATLTGAARVALGPEITPFYCRRRGSANEIGALSMSVSDPMWAMPLWDGYDKWLSSKIADINHISTGPFAGSITAALFLSRFVSKTRDWVHCDVYGWNAKPRPGRPVGGEATAIRALYYFIAKRYD